MVNEEMIHYLERLLPKKEEAIVAMEQYAHEHHVPIMDALGIETMLHILKLVQPTRILEIGTAIGYSAIRMAKALPNAHIVTIERDEMRYKQALVYAEQTNTKAQMTLLFGDALHISDEVKKHAPFDVLFIDAAKGQYRRFFELYEPLLSERGIIITDNVLFKGLVATNEPIEQKRIRQLIKKIQAYNEWLMAHPRYETVIIPIGDGMAISRKRGQQPND
ncbi:O-methyltransferase [Anoxybacillus flavithermus]|uniref:tRNA 5-hydroxyuridine methyltransferase n=1 Tax=Anoxybacillus flavithermus TaxID=33934 RepID=A0AAX2A486_9BACL|nr:O-methyltransferase [Anoxybacillus flavithermus]ASA97871.1 SAM-dependent methyltransferase [Anoxybacillus flavithermus]MBE2906398.1 O-methyltransferase [Anoxybacillus flavithermus]MBE2908212.1 O-methyltransferase [Anoxybacillus flavithermus]MBE2909581.1 O-methyltransferase [Anoxybacillus flavithermus]MBE2911861.1 O-methyltransferase [Anoxybacillus flavithermus]